MKKIVLGLCAVSLASNLALAKEYKDDSIDSENKVYGRLKTYIGFEAQRYDNSMYDSLGATERMNKSALFGFGYNMYYKLDKNVHLFAGSDFQLRFGEHNNKFQATDNANNQLGEGSTGIAINDFARANLRLGAKINLCKYIAIEPYATGGANLIKAQRQVRFGYNVGIGADLVFNDRFFIGAEYRYTNSDAAFDLNQTGGTFKFRTYSFLGRIGLQF